MRRSSRVQPVSWTVIASHEGYKFRIWGESKGIVVGCRKVIMALLACGQLFVVSAATPSKQEMSDGSNPSSTVHDSFPFVFDNLIQAKQAAAKERD